LGEFIQMMTTIDSKEGAQKLAKSLVEKRLAACTQVIGPIMSTYWWQGKIETTEEWLCLIKTRQEIYAEVEAHIRAHHSYDEPEILAIPVVAGSRGYLDWITSETEKNKQ
jgi:periplasmic divalent cation tolerance protein